MLDALLIITLVSAAGISQPVGSALETEPQASMVFEVIGMGPDPGGKSGDGVTPSTTKTGQPVENNGSDSKKNTGSDSAQPGQGANQKKDNASGDAGNPKR